MRVKQSFLISFFLFFFSCVAININAQDYIEMQLVGIIDSDNDKLYFNGKINLKDNSSINGTISINHLKNGTYFTLFEKNGKSTSIPNKEIKNVILHSENAEETKFSAIKEDHILYREVFKKNENVIVYDSSERPFKNKLYGKIYVKEYDTLTNTFDFWTSGPKKDLINYINNRDETKYKRRDFQSLNDLFAKL